MNQKVGTKKMASEFKIGDLVWAKLKGFPAWPGQVIEPKLEVKRPADKKRTQHFVLFLGSNNYAWVPDDCLWLYDENREKFMITQRLPKGFQDAVNEMEDMIKKAATSTSSKKGLAKVAKSAAGNASSAKELSSENTKKSKKTPKQSEPAAKKRGSTLNESSSAKPVKQRRVQKESTSSSSVDAVSPKAPIDFDDALVAHPSANHRRRSTSGVDSKHIESVKSPFMPDILPVSPSSDVFSKRSGASSPVKIGFLGLGTIGSAIVANLLKTGHEVTVWNRNMSKCRNYIADGALRGNSPCEVVQSCDITISCVSDPSALKDLVFGNSGVLQGISVGKTYVDMSTVDLETISDVSEAVVARGGRFLEAPLIGDKQLAVSGRLIILAAGDQSAYDDCASCFEAIGKKFYLGDTGLGVRMKLVLGMFVGTTLAALAESLALSAKLGLNLTHVLDVLRHSSANSQFVQQKGADMAASRFETVGCKLSLMQKDMKLAINMSDSVDQPLHVGSAVNELFKKAKAKGYAENDVSAVYRAANL